MAIAFTFGEDHTVWWSFLNFGCIDCAIIRLCFPTSFLIFLLLHRLFSREATLLTQVVLQVNSSSCLGNAFVIHQRQLKRMPVSFMGPDSETIRINGKTPANKALMPVQIRFQSSARKGLLMVIKSLVLDNLVHGHIFCVKENVFSSIPL